MDSAPTLLQPDEQLTSVVFIFDYMQLVFGEATLSLYLPPVFTTGDRMLSVDDEGFCDGVVALIGQSARMSCSDAGLELRFSDGKALSVPSGDAQSPHPEAWQFGRSDGLIVVQPNHPRPAAAKGSTK